MPTYVMLTNLTSEGVKTIRNNPQWTNWPALFADSYRHRGYATSRPLK